MPVETLKSIYVIGYVSSWLFAALLLVIAFRIFREQLGGRAGTKFGILVVLGFLALAVCSATALYCINGCPLDSVANQIYHMDDLWP